MENNNKNPQITGLTKDLHEALQKVPLNIEYFDKLELYSKILIEDYNWKRVEVYSTHDQLDSLVAGARVTTSDNELAVKHDTGWVVLTSEGYLFSRKPSSDLTLPVFSIPVNRSHSLDNVSLGDGSTNGTQTP